MNTLEMVSEGQEHRIEWAKGLYVGDPKYKSGMCQVLKYTTLYFFVFSVSYI